MSKIENALIFLFGKKRKTRWVRIMITLAVVTFLILLLFGVTLDLGPLKITPVADIEIRK